MPFDVLRNMEISGPELKCFKLFKIFRLQAIRKNVDICIVYQIRRAKYVSLHLLPLCVLVVVVLSVIFLHFM